MDHIGNADPTVVSELVDAVAVERFVPLVCYGSTLENGHNRFAKTPEPDISEEKVSREAKPVMDAK
jgi:hypothetical protein